MSYLFDEYTETINERIRFGILFTHRAISEEFISDRLSPKEERDIMSIMKLSAIKAIRKELDEEYARLEKEYNFIENEIIGEIECQ